MIERTPIWDDRTLHGWRRALKRLAEDYSWEMSEEEAEADPAAGTLAKLTESLDTDANYLWAAVHAANAQNSDDLSEAAVLAAGRQFFQRYDGWDELLQEVLDEHHGNFELKYTTEEWQQQATKDLRNAHPTWIDSAALEFGDKSSVYMFNRAASE